MKGMLKRIGRCFFDLRENRDILNRSILVIDNGRSLFGRLTLLIKTLLDYYPKAEISVLIGGQRRNDLENEFPALKYISPSKKLKPRKYSIALSMLFASKKNYDLIVLSSLDITPLIVALLFKQAKVLLFNRWEQWWSISLRKVSQLFKKSYVKRDSGFSYKGLLKSLGLFFILIVRKNEEALKEKILLVDNGYTLYKQIEYAIHRIKEAYPKVKISVLALWPRQELRQHFPDYEIITAKNYLIDRYRLAASLMRIRKNRFNYIVLFSLDISPIVAAMHCGTGKLFLYNQWHQWWSLKLRVLTGYFVAIPKFIVNLIINAVVFVFILLEVRLIFLRKAFNTFKFDLLKQGAN